MNKHRCSCENPAVESIWDWYHRATLSTEKPVDGNRRAQAEVYTRFFPTGREFSVRIGTETDWRVRGDSRKWFLELGRLFGGDSLNMEQAGAVIEATIPRDQWDGGGQNALDLYAGRPVQQKNVIREKLYPPRKIYGWLQKRKSDEIVEDRPILSKQGNFAVYANANEGDIPKSEIRYDVYNLKTGEDASRHGSIRIRDAIALAKKMNAESE